MGRCLPSQVQSSATSLSARQHPINFHTRSHPPHFSRPLRCAHLTERADLTLPTHTPYPLRPINRLTMSTAEPLHKQCRTLESLFDNKLTAYSRLAATITRPGSNDLESTGSLERWQDLEVELEELLQKASTGSAWVLSFLTISGGRSWERSTTNSIHCQMMRAIK